MHTTSLDNIISRQRGRTIRDRVFVLGIALIVVLGFGAVAASAHTATTAAPSATLVR